MANRSLKSKSSKSSNYVKNVGKSFGYIGYDVFKSFNPGIAEMLSDTKELAQDIASSASDMKQTAGDKVRALELKKTIANYGKDTWSNFKDDLRSGNFYNRERSEQAQSEAMSGMFGDDDFDFDFDFDDDGGGDFSFDDDEDYGDGTSDPDQYTADTIKEASKSEINASIKNTNFLADTIGSSAEYSTKRIVNSNVASSEYLANVQKQTTGILVNTLEVGHASINNSLANLNVGVTALARLAEPMAVHFQNASTFYTKSSEYQNKMIGYMEQLIQNTSPEDTRFKSSKKYTTIDDLVNYGGGFNVRAYADMIKENFAEMKDTVSSFAEFAKLFTAGAGGPKNSPISALLGMGLKGLIPKDAKKSMTDFNDFLEPFFKTLIGNMQNKDHGIIGSMIADFLLPQSRYSDKLDPSNYNKGKVSWNGKSQKALMEVIPFQLSQIVSALTGQEQKIFDYDSGKWKRVSGVKKDFDAIRNSVADSAGGDYVRTLENTISNLVSENAISEEQQKAMMEQIRDYVRISMSERDDRFRKVEEDDFNYQKSGLDKETWEFIRNFNKSLKQNGNQKLFTEFVGNTFTGRDTYGNKIRKMSESGESVFNALFNESLFEDKNELETIRKFKEKNKGKGILPNERNIAVNLGHDEYGYDIWHYLQGLYSFTKHLSDNIEYLGGGGYAIQSIEEPKKGKDRRGKKAPTAPMINLAARPSLKPVTEITNKNLPTNEIINQKAKVNAPAYAKIDETSLKNATAKVLDATANEAVKPMKLSSAAEEYKMRRDQAIAAGDPFTKDDKLEAEIERAEKINDDAQKVLDKVSESTVVSTAKDFQNSLTRVLGSPARAISRYLNAAQVSMNRMLFGDDGSGQKGISETFREDMESEFFKPIKDLMTKIFAPFKGVADGLAKVLFGKKNEDGVWSGGPLDWMANGVNTGLKKSKDWVKNLFWYDRKDKKEEETTEEAKPEERDEVAEAYEDIFDQQVNAHDSKAEKQKDAEAERKSRTAKIFRSKQASHIRARRLESLKKRQQQERDPDYKARRYTEKGGELDWAYRKINEMYANGEDPYEYINNTDALSIENMTDRQHFHAMRKELNEIRKGKDPVLSRSDKLLTIDDGGYTVEIVRFDEEKGEYFISVGTRGVRHYLGGEKEFRKSYSYDPKFKLYIDRENIPLSEVENIVDSLDESLLNRKNTSKKFTGAKIKKSKPNVDQAAHGRKITKTGLVAVSEGELIIPSEYNPFYHKKTDKAQQIRNENSVVNRFFGKFTKGGTVREKAEDLSGKEAGKFISEKLKKSKAYNNIVNKIISAGFVKVKNRKDVSVHLSIEGPDDDIVLTFTNDKDGKSGKIVLTEDVLKRAGVTDSEMEALIDDINSMDIAGQFAANTEDQDIDEDYVGDIINKAKSGAESVKSGAKKLYEKGEKKVSETLENLNEKLGTNKSAKDSKGGKLGRKFSDARDISTAVSIAVEKLFGSAKEKALKGLEKLFPKKEGEDESKLRKNLTSITDALFKDGDKKDNITAGITGALIGGGVSVLTGSIIGPVFGAAIGGAAGMIIKSKEVQRVLFGHEDKDGNYKKGLLPEKVAKFMQKNVPGMGKGAAVGGIGGLFLGSPVLGAVVGSAVGYIKSSEQAQVALFGEKDKETGERKNGGFISKEKQDKFKKLFPAIGVGALAGAMLGPFGLAGNLILGSAVGYATQTDKFKKWLFGDVDKDGNPTGEGVSFINLLKENIADPVVGIFDKLSQSIKVTIRDTFHSLSRQLRKTIVKELSIAFGPLQKFGKNMLDKGLGLLSKAIGGEKFSIGRVLKGTNTRLENRALRKGHSIRDRKLGRNLTAEERRARRAENGVDGGAYESFDTALAGVESVEQMRTLRDAIKNSIDPEKSFEKAEIKNATNAVNILGAYKTDLKNKGALDHTSRKAIKKIEQYIRNEQYTEAEKGIKTMSDVFDEDTTSRLLNQILKAQESKVNKHKKRHELKDVFKDALKNAGVTDEKIINDILSANDFDLMNMLDLVKDESAGRALKSDKENAEEEQEKLVKESVTVKIPNILQDILNAIIGKYKPADDIDRVTGTTDPNTGNNKEEQNIPLSQRLLPGPVPDTEKDKAEKIIENAQEAANDNTPLKEYAFDGEWYDQPMYEMLDAHSGDNVVKIFAREMRKRGKVKKNFILTGVQGTGMFFTNMYNPGDRTIVDINELKNKPAGPVLPGPTIDNDPNIIDVDYKDPDVREVKSEPTDAEVGDGTKPKNGERKQTEDGITMVYTNGEWKEDTSDNSTKKAVEKKNKIYDYLAQLPIIGGAVTGFSGLFGNFKDALIGDGKDGKKGLLTKLKEKLFGEKDNDEEGGLFNKIVNFFVKPDFKDGFKMFMSGGKELIGAAGTLALPAIWAMSLSGKFDEVVANIIDKIIPNSEADGHTRMEDSRDVSSSSGKAFAHDENGNRITNDQGLYMMEDGTYEDTSVQYIGSNNSFSSSLKKNLVNGVLTSHSSLGTLALKGTKKGLGKAVTGLKSMKNGVTKIFGKTVTGSADDVVKAASKKGAHGINALAEAASKNAGGIASMIMSHVDDGLKALAKALHSVPFVSKYADDIAFYFFNPLRERIGKGITAGGAKIFKFASKLKNLVPFIAIGTIAAKAINGWGNAEIILSVKEATTGQKLIASVIAGLNAAIPLIGDLIPNKVLVDMFVNIAPKLGIDISEFQKQRQELTDEVNKFNEETGSNLSEEEYLQKELGKGGIFTKMGNGIKGFVANAKDKGLKFAAKDAADKLGTGIKKTGAKIKETYENSAIGKALGKADDFLGVSDLFKTAMSGDIGKFFAYDAKDKDDSTFTGIIKNGIGLGIKTTLTPVALIGAASKPLKHIASSAIGWVKDIGRYVEENNQLGKDIMDPNNEKGLANLMDKIEPPSSVGPLKWTLMGIGAVSRLMPIISAVVGKIGRALGEKWGIMTGAISADWAQAQNVMEVIKQNAEDGNVKDMLMTKFRPSKDNPIGGLQGMAIGGYAIGQLVVMPFKAAGKKISEWWAPMSADMSKDWAAVQEAQEVMKKNSDSGNIKAIWTEVKFEGSQMNPIGFIHEIIVGVSQMFYSIVGGVKKLFGGIGGLFDDAKDFAKGKLQDWGVLDKEEVDEDGNTVVKEGWWDKAKRNVNSWWNKGFASWVASGTGMAAGSSGFVSQNDPRYANKQLGGHSVGEMGCGPAAATMALNMRASGTNMNEAIGAAQGYQTPKGTDAGYFADFYRSKGVQAQYYSNPNDIAGSIAAGTPTILMGSDPTNTSKKNSPFGPNNHYVVASGFDKKGNIIINDPEMKRPRKYSSSILNSVHMGVGMGSGLVKHYFGKSAGGGYLRVDEVTTGVWGFLTSHGYSEAATAGIMGNMDAESNTTPDAQQPNGDYAIGLCQWAGDRKTSLINFADSRGVQWTDLATQLEFLLNELESGGQYLGGKADKYKSLAEFKAADDVDQACIDFEKAFERAGKPVFDVRLKAARYYYEQFTGKTFTNPVPNIGGVGGAVSAGLNSLKSISGIANPNGTSSNSTASTIGKTAAIGAAVGAATSSGGLLDKIKSAFSTAFGASALFGGLASSSSSSASTSSSTPGSVGSAMANGASALANIGRRALSSAHFTGTTPIEYMRAIAGQNEYSQTGPRDPEQGSADCSSTVQWAIKKATGLDIGGYTGAQYNNENLDTVWYDNGNIASEVPAGVQPNDVLFFRRSGSRNPDGVGHVELYTGNGMMIGHGSGKGPTEKKVFRGGKWDTLIKVARVHSEEPQGKKALRVANTEMRESAAGSGLLHYMDTHQDQFSAAGSGLSYKRSGRVQMPRRNTSNRAFIGKSAGNSQMISLSSGANTSAITNKLGGSNAGDTKNVALLVKSLIPLIEAIVRNTSSIDAIRQLVAQLVHDKGDDAGIVDKAMGIITGSMASNKDIDADLKGLKETVENILAG